MPTATLKRSADELSIRRFDGLPTTVDEGAGTFTATVTTETPVKTLVAKPGAVKDEYGFYEVIEADEVLPAAGLDYSRTPNMHLLDNHNNTSVDDILGGIRNVRQEGQAIVADAELIETRKYLAREMTKGIFGQVSAGYCVEPEDYEYVERPGQRLLAIAKRWTLHEVSLVTVSADPYAAVRSKKQPIRQRAADQTQAQETKTMDLEELVTAAEGAIAAVMNAADDGASDDVVARAKALRAFGTAEDDPKNKDDTTDSSGDATQTDEEKKQVEEARALARSYGKTKLVDDMSKLGARASEIRTALRSAIVAGAGASAADKQDVTPAQRSADVPASLNTLQIYQRENSRFRGANRA
jgi:hypothetical protein